MTAVLSNPGLEVGWVEMGVKPGGFPADSSACAHSVQAQQIKHTAGEAVN